MRTSFNVENQKSKTRPNLKRSMRLGRSLSMYSSSTMAINPDITEAHALRGWYDLINSPIFFTALIKTASPQVRLVRLRIQFPIA